MIWVGDTVRIIPHTATLFGGCEGVVILTSWHANQDTYTVIVKAPGWSGRIKQYIHKQYLVKVNIEPFEVEE